jgi:phosphohistidine phosphatase
MTIYFLRHASAGKNRANPKQDEKRPLDKEGIVQCREIGRALAACDTQVDAIVSSPLKRATQTASLVGNELGFEGALKIEAALRPDASYDDFQKMLEKYSKFDSIMVVGHNPNESEFCSLLLTE